MYCIKCGVELADSERVCPLCGTRVFHPDLPCGQGEPPYPPDEHPRHEEVSRIGVMFVVSVCMLLPAVISVLCDWRINGRIIWSGFVVGGLALLLGIRAALKAPLAAALLIPGVLWLLTAAVGLALPRVLSRQWTALLRPILGEAAKLCALHGCVLLLLGLGLTLWNNLAKRRRYSY